MASKRRLVIPKREPGRYWSGVLMTLLPWWAEFGVVEGAVGAYFTASISIGKAVANGEFPVALCTVIPSTKSPFEKKAPCSENDV